jgi:hypothetical protein
MTKIVTTPLNAGQLFEDLPFRQTGLEAVHKAAALIQECDKAPDGNKINWQWAFHHC